jgi:hypothetical protein
MSFHKYLHTVDLIKIRMSEDDDWTEQVYIDKQTNKPVALLVYPFGHMQHFIYFDEPTCKELYPDKIDYTFHTFGINWYICMSKENQDSVQKCLISSDRIFNYIKTKLKRDHSK